MSCAERLLPIFSVGEESWSWHGRSDEFKAMLDSCWALAGAPSDPTALSRVLSADSESLVRDGNLDDSRGYRLFVYQAIPTLEAALLCAREPMLEAATDAAEKEYDAMFRITDWGLRVTARTTSKPATVDEARAAELERLDQQLRDPLIQTCLNAQNESADELAVQLQPGAPFRQSFKEKAQADGRRLAGLAIETYPRRR